LAGLPLSLHAPQTTVTLKSAVQFGTAGALTLIKLQSGAVINVGAGDLKGQALQVKNVEPTCVSSARITLASGTLVVVPLADIVDGVKIGQRAAADCKTSFAPSASATSSASGLPSDQAALGEIRRKCAADWPNDFRMRNFCEQQQLKALDELRRRR
jgi:hypothetical protein